MRNYSIRVVPNTTTITFVGTASRKHGSFISACKVSTTGDAEMAVGSDRPIVHVSILVGLLVLCQLVAVTDIGNVIVVSSNAIRENFRGRITYPYPFTSKDTGTPDGPK